MSKKLIVVNMDEAEENVGSCTTCGIDFADNDYVVVWKEHKHHMTCFIELVENIDSELGYILGEVFDTEFIFNFCEQWQTIDTHRSEEIFKKYSDDITSMLFKLYHHYKMDGKLDDQEAI